MRCQWLNVGQGHNSSRFWLQYTQYPMNWTHIIFNAWTQNDFHVYSVSLISHSPSLPFAQLLFCAIKMSIGHSPWMCCEPLRNDLNTNVLRTYTLVTRSNESHGCWTKKFHRSDWLRHRHLHHTPFDAQYWITHFARKSLHRHCIHTSIRVCLYTIHILFGIVSVLSIDLGTFAASVVVIRSFRENKKKLNGKTRTAQRINVRVEWHTSCTCSCHCRCYCYSSFFADFSGILFSRQIHSFSPQNTQRVRIVNWRSLDSSKFDWLMPNVLRSIDSNMHDNDTFPF